MKVGVDTDRCRGHGACVVSCPEVFDLDPSGFAVVLSEDVAAEHEAGVRAAAANCPERAILVSD